MSGVAEMSVQERLVMLRKRVDYQGFILGFICAAVTVSILLVAALTEAPIEQRLIEDRLEILHQLLPEAMFDNDPFSDSIEIVDQKYSEQPVIVSIAKKENLPSAFIYQVQTEGYGGTITLMLAVDPVGQVLGVRVLSHKETPGLADKIEIDKSDWITSFDGKSLANTTASAWAVKKDGGQFDQFTGATITPRAIVQGMVEALSFYQRQKALLMNEVPAEEE